MFEYAKQNIYATVLVICFTNAEQAISKSGCPETELHLFETAFRMVEFMMNMILNRMCGHRSGALCQKPTFCKTLEYY